MKSVANSIKDKDYKGMAAQTAAAIFNKKKHDGMLKDNQFKHYVADRMRTRDVRRTDLENENRGRV